MPKTSPVSFGGRFQSGLPLDRTAVFDGRGYPQFNRGKVDVDGLYFIGLPWLHAWGSGRCLGMADDAHYLASVIHGKLFAV